ncbi:hypothetical protein BGZ76_009312 [Entomortierella beljakovae]|nr:hypothetical protein BGZ76_009312 [Entomortierella beljakovae]
MTLSRPSSSASIESSETDSPIMTKSSRPINPPVPSNSSSRKFSFNHKHEWPNGKRPKGFLTKEGKEAAEKSKNNKPGVSIPHLSAPCTTYEGVLKHAVLGAIRSGGITYGLKALVNLLLKMMKKKGNEGLVHSLKDAFLGSDAIRFGTFFGMFSFLWKLVNNGLKLFRGKDDRINGAVAGAIAGLSILIESPERRVSFAQTMLVRAGQGVYNAGKYRGVFSFRYGDALLFALACGQIQYAYTIQPKSIPPEYLKFIINTAKVPVEALAFNRAHVRGFPVDVSEVVQMVKKYRGTPNNIEIASKLTEYPPVIPCAVIHPHMDSCSEYNVKRFIEVTREILPVYATLNFVPLLVLRLKKLMQDPTGVLTKVSFNTLRSSVFLAVYVVVYHFFICSQRNLIIGGYTTANFKALYWIYGFICSGAGIMVEQEGRRAELAMYVLPKAVESVYKILQQRNYVKGVKHWEVMTFSAAMSIIMSFYQREEQVLSPLVTKLLYHIVGPN